MLCPLNARVCLPDTVDRSPASPALRPAQTRGSVLASGLTMPQPGVNGADHRQCHSPWPHHATAAANISYVADGERAGTFFDHVL